MPLRTMTMLSQVKSKQKEDTKLGEVYGAGIQASFHFFKVAIFAVSRPSAVKLHTRCNPDFGLQVIGDCLGVDAGAYDAHGFRCGLVEHSIFVKALCQSNIRKLAHRVCYGYKLQRL